MRSFNLSGIWKLGTIFGYIEGLKPVEGGKLLPYENEHEGLSETIAALSAMGAVVSMKSMKRLETYARGNKAVDVATIAQMIAELRGRFVDESESVQCFFMERKRAQYWTMPAAGWEQVIAKLPQEATDDVTEAGKCYACSRYTACVHHLCRVLECGFKDFATRHGVTFKYAIEQTSWKQLSDDLKAHKDTHTGLTPAETAAFNKVRDQINVIASLWRNPTAHSTGTFYTDEQALAIYHAVRQLTGDLVKL